MSISEKKTLIKLAKNVKRLKELSIQEGNIELAKIMLEVSSDLSDLCRRFKEQNEILISVVSSLCVDPEKRINKLSEQKTMTKKIEIYYCYNCGKETWDEEDLCEECWDKEEKYSTQITGSLDKYFSNGWGDGMEDKQNFHQKRNNNARKVKI